MRSLILLLVFLVPWVLVCGLAYGAVYVGVNGSKDKELLGALALGAGLAAVFLAMPTTMMVMSILFPENKDKK